MALSAWPLALAVPLLGLAATAPAERKADLILTGPPSRRWKAATT